LDTKGNFISIKPNDPHIAKYIAYYYFHKSDDPDFHKKFFFYPNYKHALTVYRNSDAKLNDHGSSVNPSDSEKLQIFYAVNTNKNLSVTLNGVFDKIGVVFNPLGLNHFIDKPLCEIFQPLLDDFFHFGESFEKVVQNVYNESDVNEKTNLLDGFFQKRWIAFDEPVLKKAVKELLNSNGAIRVEELSEMLQVNRKTLLRLFKKHLCCSVEEYKKLVMFRNALNYSQQKNGLLSLTDIALFNLYYDQAHFIKQFKSITKLSPKTLLSKITQLGNQELYWNFDD